MTGWHHQCNGHEPGQTLEDGEGQGSLVCCSSWSHEESDTTGRPNNTTTLIQLCIPQVYSAMSVGIFGCHNILKFTGQPLTTKIIWSKSGVQRFRNTAFSGSTQITSIDFTWVIIYGPKSKHCRTQRIDLLLKLLAVSLATVCTFWI